MGKKGAVSSGKRSPFGQVGSEGDRATQQSKSISCSGLSSSGRSTPGGHQLSLGHFRCEAGAYGSINTQQNVLFLLAYYQGPREQHASLRCYPGEEYTSLRLREAHRRQWSKSSRLRQVCRGRRYGEHITWSGLETTGIGPSHSVYGKLIYRPDTFREYFRQNYHSM